MDSAPQKNGWVDDPGHLTRQCPQLAPNGPASRGDQCLLIGVKQT